MEQTDFYKRFLSLGWHDNIIGKSVFNFLMAARNEVAQDCIMMDLGAGQCRYKFFFEHCNYFGVDFGGGDKNWDYSKLDFLGDITNLSFVKDESVDFCLNTVTLEHICEPSAFFGEVNRILKPGGKIYAQVPLVAEQHQEPYDFFRYTSYGLRHLVEKHGMSVISCDPICGRLLTLASCYRQSLREMRFPANEQCIKIIMNLLRFVECELMPLSEQLDAISVGENKLPFGWLLVAQKPGEKTKPVHYADKKEAALSLIRCPECRGSLNQLEESYLCKACNIEFPHSGGPVDFLSFSTAKERSAA